MFFDFIKHVFQNLLHNFTAEIFLTENEKEQVILQN